jgi:hypothetical protein
VKSLKKRVKEELVRSPEGLTVRELYDKLQPQKAFSIETALVALENTEEAVLGGFRENGAAIYRAK